MRLLIHILPLILLFSNILADHGHAGITMPVGAATGGAAFLAAGGGAAGAGGFAAGAAGGMVGSAFSMPILSVGNTAYFGDPLMTGQQYLTGIAVGGLLGGATNGITALVNGKTFWSGNVKPPPMTPTTIRPELPSLNSSKPEVNTDGLRSRPLEMTPERPVFSETLEPGPITVKMSGELREVEIVAKVGNKFALQFGKTENQIYHAFRHTDALGLDRAIVKSTIETHIKTVSSQVVSGKPFNQIIEIGGQKIQYTIYKLSDGTLNIGRIHGIP